MQIKQVDPGTLAKDSIALKEIIEKQFSDSSVRCLSNNFTSLLLPNAQKFIHPLLILHGDGDLFSEYHDVEEFFNLCQR